MTVAALIEQMNPFLSEITPVSGVSGYKDGV
jgi:hypothetical protein